MVGLVGITLLSVFAAISGVVVDFTASHVYNPAWPPHAQFHGYLSVARTVLIMAAVIALVWGPVRRGDRFAWGVLVFLLLGWLAVWCIAPIPVPGTGDRATCLVASGLAPLYVLSLRLVRPPLPCCPPHQRHAARIC